MAKKNTPMGDAEQTPEAEQPNKEAAPEQSTEPAQEQPAQMTEDRAKVIADAVAETANKLMEALSGTEIEQMLAQVGIAKPTAATRCISCGMPGQVTFDGDHFHCGVCGHIWAIEDEQSPFRRLQQGKL
jgi:rubrerythrin